MPAHYENSTSCNRAPSTTSMEKAGKRLLPLGETAPKFSSRKLCKFSTTSFFRLSFHPTRRPTKSAATASVPKTKTAKAARPLLPPSLSSSLLDGTPWFPAGPATPILETRNSQCGPSYSGLQKHPGCLCSDSDRSGGMMKNVRKKREKDISASRSSSPVSQLSSYLHLLIYGNRFHANTIIDTKGGYRHTIIKFRHARRCAYISMVVLAKLARK
jgi:hypothetical protein